MFLLAACAASSSVEPSRVVRMPLDGDLPPDDGNWNACTCETELQCDQRHLGVDLVARAGTVVWPVETGRVVHLGGPAQADGWGRGLSAVFVRHGAPGEEYVVVYGHVWPRVEVGDLVTPDQPLGTIGTYYEIHENKSRFSVSHLHFGIRPGPEMPPGPTGRVFDLGCARPDDTLGFVAPLSFVRERRATVATE